MSCSATDSSSRVYRKLTIREAYDLFVLGAPVERQYSADSPYDSDTWRPVAVVYGQVDSFRNFVECYGTRVNTEFLVETEFRVEVE